MSYTNCISLNDALYFDLFDEIPYRQVKQFFEKDIDKDELDFEVEIENLPYDRPAYGKVKFTFTLMVDINVNGSLSIMRPNTFTKILEYNTSSAYALKLIDLQEEEEEDEDEEDEEEDETEEDKTEEDETDEEELPTCCGKHCDETKGLKLGMGYNRWYSSKADMITEQLWCEYCYPLNIGNECKCCSKYHPYTEMIYVKGEGKFYCKPCIKYFNSIDYDPDE